MIYYYINLILLFFFGMTISFLLKLNMLDWNNLWEEKGIKLELSEAQFSTFLLFSLFLTLNFILYKEVNFKINLIFLFSLFFLMVVLRFTVKEENISRILFNIKPYFFSLDKIFNTFKKEEKRQEEDVSEKEIKAYIDMGMEQGFLEEKERIMLENIIDFSETLVNEIMTPRTDMVVVSFDSTYEEVKETFMESNFSRLPVIENSLDNIKGIIFLKDFFKIKDPEKFNIKEIIKEANFVPEMKKVSDLLKEMQEKHFSISIVIDEYGGTLGLVTMEDLLEELIGEIEDEHTIPEKIILGKDSFSFAGKTHIEEVEELIGIEIEKGDYDTLAGFLIHLFGKIPEENQEIAYKGYNFRIEIADKRRIYRVLVKKYGK